MALPLDADDYDLPAPDDLDSLSNEVNVLGRRIMLASSGGVRYYELSSPRRSSFSSSLKLSSRGAACTNTGGGVGSG